MQEITKRPMVDILTQSTGKQVVMKEDSYVFFETLKKLTKMQIEEGIALQEDIYKKDINAQKVDEAKKYLDDTEHKFVSDYEFKPGETQEDLDKIKIKRSEARKIIRGF
jgi:bisphosphoglycerate-dependent phosphoglycerate mutase